jgi:hypothetical protein
MALMHKYHRGTLFYIRSLYIAPFLSADVEAGGADFLSSDLLFALELNNIPVNTAKAPVTMAYMKP